MNSVSDWNLVKSFVALADHPHPADAAQQLGVTVRTLRHRVHALEDELGVALVTPTRQRTRLTPAGHWLRDALTRPLAEADDALMGAHRHIARSVTIAISIELPHAWTERVGEWIYTTSPGARLDLKPPQEAVALLRAGELDLVLLAHDPGDQPSRIVGDEPLVVLFPEDHPAAAQRSIRAGDLFDLPVAVSETAGDEWQRMAHLLHGRSDGPLIPTARLATIRQALIQTVRTDHAAALTLAAAIAQSDTAGLAVRPLQPPLAIPVILIAHPDTPDELLTSLTMHLVDTPQLPPAISQRRPQRTL